MIQAQQIPNTYAGINRFFNVCAESEVATPEDVDYLIEIIADSLGTMAMVNYPYATNFVKPLPAWPVHAGCYNASVLIEEPNDDPREFNNLGI
jgi:lysosomal Pro-X carboxypeptidase